MNLKSILVFTLLVVFSAVQAADLIVEENALSPNYSSIGAAVNAAQDGDRIIIKNKPGNVPWVEDITINKSLTFLSFANDTFFRVQGDYTIDHAPGREVIINGMRNILGQISASGNGTGGFMDVHIVNSRLESGSIVLNSDYYMVNVAGNQLDRGRVLLNYGRVIGNDIDAIPGFNGIQINEGSVSVTDTVKVFFFFFISTEDAISSDNGNVFL